MSFEVFKIVRPDKNNPNIFYSSSNLGPSGYMYERGVRKDSTTPIFVFTNYHHAIEFSGVAPIARGYSTSKPFAMHVPFVLNPSYSHVLYPDMVETFWELMHKERYEEAKKVVASAYYSSYYLPNSYGVYNFTLEEIIRPGKGIYEAQSI